MPKRDLGIERRCAALSRAIKLFLMRGAWVLRRLGFWRLLWLALWPPARRRYDERLFRGMRFLVEHPEIPVEIEE